MNDPYRVYIDLDVVNHDYSSTSEPQLRFGETRDTPFLPGDSAEYFCSIVRFNVQTVSTLPVFILGIKRGKGDIKRTIYKVSFEHLATVDTWQGAQKKLFTGSANAIYQPEDTTATFPATPHTSQDLSNNYYNVYSYHHFIL